MKVSVIVPMYNVESYITQCLDSLKQQTLASMEVILVDDGCTDGTVSIVKSYLERYPERFQLIQKENGGLSDARNTGIPYAKGEYLAFLDSDDFVEPTFYEKMANKMDEGYDVVVTDIEYYYENPEKRYVLKGLSPWHTDSIQKKALLSPLFAWNKLYRREVFVEDEMLRFPLHSWYEDIPVTTLVFARAKRIGYVPETLVHYRQREGSIMSAKKDDRMYQIFPILMQMRDRFEKLGLLEQYQEEIEYLFIEHLRLYGMFRFIRSEDWEDLYDKSEEIMKQFYPNWKQNKYLMNLNYKNRMFLRFYNKKTAKFFHSLIQ